MITLQNALKYLVDMKYKLLVKKMQKKDLRQV